MIDAVCARDRVGAATGCGGYDERKRFASIFLSRMIMHDREAFLKK